jgi:hypothetical protein
LENELFSQDEGILLCADWGMLLDFSVQVWQLAAILVVAMVMM